MQTAIQQKIRKLVVLGQAYMEPLSDTRSLIAALLEKIVFAQGRNQNEAEDTSVSYIRPTDDDVLGVVDTAFEQV